MNNETVLSDAKPCCYCCGTDENLTEHSNGKGLVYWLCSECQGATFRRVKGLAILVCPCHGEQHHKDADLDSVKYYQLWASKRKYWYDAPVMTRECKEQGKNPKWLLDYVEI